MWFVDVFGGLSMLLYCGMPLVWFADGLPAEGGCCVFFVLLLLSALFPDDVLCGFVDENIYIMLLCVFSVFRRMFVWMSDAFPGVGRTYVWGVCCGTSPCVGFRMFVLGFVYVFLTWGGGPVVYITVVLGCPSGVFEIFLAWYVDVVFVYGLGVLWYASLCGFCVFYFRGYWKFVFG